jgi:hypothetical protein
MQKERKVSIRDKIIGQRKNFHKITFDLSGGEQLEIREPSIFEVNMANNLRFTKDDKGELKLKDNSHLDITLYYLINLVTDTDGQKIFEETDKDTIFNHSANSDTARLIEALWQVIRGDLTPKKPLQTPKEA